MTANTSICQRVFGAMAPRVQYYLRELRAMDALRGIEDQQLRNALVSLQVNGRLLKVGSHGHQRYYINPVQPLMRADAARATQAVLRASPPALPRVAANAPVWPAPDTRRRLDPNPYARIAA